MSDVEEGGAGGPCTMRSNASWGDGHMGTPLPCGQTDTRVKIFNFPHLRW